MLISGKDQLKSVRSFVYNMLMVGCGERIGAICFPLLTKTTLSQLNFSARAYHRILKLARTIADLVGCEEIQSVHLAEALQYRPKLMMN